MPLDKDVLFHFSVHWQQNKQIYDLFFFFTLDQLFFLNVLVVVGLPVSTHVGTDAPHREQILFFLVFSKKKLKIKFFIF